MSGIVESDFPYDSAHEVFGLTPLDIQVVLCEINKAVNTIDQAGEYGEQFKNVRGLLTTGLYKIFLKC